MKPVIEIVIATTGEIKIDAVGFKGTDCAQATKYLEEALGAVKLKVKKPEYHQQQQQKREQRISS